MPKREEPGDPDHQVDPKRGRYRRSDDLADPNGSGVLELVAYRKDILLARERKNVDRTHLTPKTESLFLSSCPTLVRRFNVSAQSITTRDPSDLFEAM